MNAEVGQFDIARIKLEPGEALVVKVRGRITQAQAEMVRGHVLAVFPGARVLVIDEAVELVGVHVP